MSGRHSGLAVLVAVIWGINFVVIDEGLAGMPPLLLVSLRFLLVVFPAVFFVPRPATDWRNVVAVGSFMSLFQFALLYLGLHRVPDAVELTGGAIMLVGVGAAVLRGRRPAVASPA